MRIYKMNNKHHIITALVLTSMAMGITSCSDDFLKEKKNYGNFNQTTAYSNFNGAQERVNNLYYWMLPVSDGGDGNGTNHPNDWTSVGNPDEWSKSTDLDFAFEGSFSGQKKVLCHLLSYGTCTLLLFLGFCIFQCSSDNTDGIKSGVLIKTLIFY